MIKHLLPLALLTLGFCQFAEARTQEEQQSMTPQEVLDALMAGNQRFQKNHGTNRDLLSEAEKTATAQYPIAAVVSCLDSRVPVEIIFDQGIGDIFVGRVAGNVENEDMVGSLEFATAASGSKLILILGHESCGAVAGAINNVELGNLTQLLEKIAKSEKHVHGVEEPHTADNPAYLNAVTEANVMRTMDVIRKMSPTIAAMEKKGDIIIVGAMYSLADGKVTLLKSKE